MKVLPIPIIFEWDKGNADKNLRKHNVTNKETEELFLNRPLKIFEDAKHSVEEQRFVVYGVTNLGRKLALVFTIRKQKIRIISARNQNKKERIAYEKSI